MELETRECGCGCGIAFKVMPKSQQFFASLTCEQEVKPENFNRGVRIAKKSEPRMDIIKRVEDRENQKSKNYGRTVVTALRLDRDAEEEPEAPLSARELGSTPIATTTFKNHDNQVVSEKPKVIEFKDLDGPVDADDMEKRWKRYIAEAKPHVVGIASARMQIAEIALKACTIHYGGGDHWNQFDGVYTMKRFAQEIGMNYKTLAEWTRTYRNVLEKLPEGVYDEKKFEAARRVSNKMDRNTAPEEVTRLYQTEIKSSQEREYLVRGIKRLRTLQYYITVKAYLPTLESECKAELNELHALCTSIIEKIT